MELIQTVHISLTEDNKPVRTTVERFTFADEVKRGSALLDRMVPGWYRDLDLDKLNLSSGYACVLGQLSMSRFQTQLRERYEEEYGDELPEDYLFDYSWVTKMFSDTVDEEWASDSSAPSEHGFFVNSYEVSRIARVVPDADEESLSRQAWEDLTYEWADAINKRFISDRKAAKAVVKAAEEAVSTPQMVEIAG